jgi:hypothetical protein
LVCSQKLSVHGVELPLQILLFGSII